MASSSASVVGLLLVAALCAAQITTPRTGPFTELNELGTPAPVLTCPPSFSAPEHFTFPTIPYRFTVNASNAGGISCTTLLLQNSQGTGSDTLFVDSFLAQGVNSPCGSASANALSITSNLNLSLGTPTNIVLTATTGTKRLLSVRIPIGAPLVFTYKQVGLEGNTLSCTFSLSINASKPTVDLSGALTTLQGISSASQYALANVSSMVSKLISLATSIPNLTPLQYLLSMLGLQQCNNILMAASPLQAATFNLGLFLQLLDALFARITPTNALGAESGGSPGGIFRTILQSSTRPLAERFDGGGLSAQNLPSSSNVPLAVTFNTSGQYTGFTSGPTSTQVAWYATVDNRLLPLPQSSAQVVSPVMTLYANTTNTAITINMTVLFSPAFFFPDLRCAIVFADASVWTLGVPPTPIGNKVVACFVNVTNQWRSFALVSTVQNNFRGRLLGARSTLKVNSDPSVAYASIAADMADMATNVNDMDADDWSFSIQVMNDAAADADTTISATSLSSLLGSADRLAQVPRAMLQTANTQYGASSQLRSSFANLGLALLASSGRPNNSPVQYAGSFATVSAVTINGTQAGYSYTTNVSSSSSSTVKFDIAQGVAPDDARLTFVLYSDDRLFTTSSTSVGSPVISATIASFNTSRLNSPATFTVPFTGSNGKCVYYIEANDTWSSVGLRLLNNTGETAQCSTWHLTNFAVLVDSTGASSVSGASATALNVFAVVGCSLSIAGLLLTMFAHIFFRSLRKSVPSKLLLCLCLALIIALGLFLLATQYQGTTGQCQALGLTMHYFWLAALCWMVVEAMNLYAVTVIVLNVDFARRLKLYNAFAWVVPGVIVGVTVAVAGISVYGGSSFCWINSSRVLLVSFLAPLAAAMFVNVILFLIVFRALHNSLTQHRKRSSMSGQPNNYRQHAREARAAVALVCLLGLAWLFGGLIDPGDASAGLVFQYLFAIFVALQGFGIFLFHCVFNEQVRSAITSYLDYRRHRAQASAASSSKNRTPALRGTGFTTRTSFADNSTAATSSSVALGHSVGADAVVVDTSFSNPLSSDPTHPREPDLPGYLNVDEDLPQN